MSTVYRESYSSSTGYGGADAAFQQADANRDGRVDLGEFRNFVGQNLGAGGSSYESSSYSNTGYGGYGAGSGYGGYGASAGYGAGYGSGYGAGYGAGYGGVGGASSYESSSYESSGGLGGAGYGAGYGTSVSTTQVQQYPTDAQGLFQDSNPQIIRRPAPGGVQTYTQNIAVRFLQPPPVPPHGPLIIREVRPPQPPVPAPLRIRQQAPPLPQLPPLVLRERPPQPPQSIASQTVIRRLAPLPVPPRSVIIERLPPLPPKPRDIIIERWVPYGAQAKRRTILQRAGPAIQYAQPRNVVIQYEPSQVRIARQFQRLGVSQASPVAYVQQYGGSLLDAGTLVQQARSAGVVEDISPPYAAASVGYSSAAYGQDLALGGGLSNYQSSSYVSGSGAGALGAGVVGLGGAGVVGLGGAGVVGLGGAGALGVGLGGLGGGSTYESSSYSSTGYGVGGGLGADAAFAAADYNHDGVLDRGEFSSVVGQGLGGAGASTYESSSYSATTSY